MAAVTGLGRELGNGNKLEGLDMPNQVNHVEMVRKVFQKTSKFDFDQEGCIKYIEEHCATFRGFRLNKNERMYRFYRDVFDGTEQLEDVLVEQGLCGGGKSRIPCVLASAIKTAKHTPYPVVRVIYSDKDEQWQLLAQMDDETILLNKHNGRWWVMMHWLNDLTFARGFHHTLISAPDRFLRFSKKLKEHFAIEKEAILTLNSCGLTIINIHDLVMHYVGGYPPESAKRDAEENRKKLADQLKGKPQEVYYLPVPKAPEFDNYRNTGKYTFPEYDWS